MTLHWQQVRRARELPMPLPPKPKRPLGPPVLFGWQGIAVRTRADIEAAGHTWDEFLDSVAADDDLRQLSMVMQILYVVPESERRDLHLEIQRRRMDFMERRAAADLDREVEEIMERPWFKRLIRRAA